MASESAVRDVGYVDAADEEERIRDGVTLPGAGIPEARDFGAVPVIFELDVGNDEDDGR